MKLTTKSKMYNQCMENELDLDVDNFVEELF